MESAENRPLKIILTGATGMVGEGVLLTCLDHSAVEKILVVGRRPYKATHQKLSELIVPDFMQLESVRDQLAGYDACFYCAGITSRGLNESQYTHITYDIPVNFAKTLASVDPEMVLCHVSGTGADATGKSRMMWARVKGRAETDLLNCGLKAVYNFRPAAMRPVDGQQSIKPIMKTLGIRLYPILRVLFPNKVSTLCDVGVAMIRCALNGYPKTTLEVPDINKLATF